MQQLMVKPTATNTSATVRPWVDVPGFVRFSDTQVDGAVVTRDPSEVGELSQYVTFLLRSRLYQMLESRRQIRLEQGFLRLNTFVELIENKNFVVDSSSELDDLAKDALSSLKNRGDEDVEEWAKRLIEGSFPAE